MIIEERAYARAGLLGNPSDGYFGKTISVSVRNFGTQIQLWESPLLHIQAAPDEVPYFQNLNQLLEQTAALGYYGGERLIKAAIVTFTDYCHDQGIAIENKNFTLQFHSSIPRQVGLAGSSAIITATMKALTRFYKVQVPKAYLPTLILKAETEQLGINAGLQDRVIQVYEGCVYMDFDKEHMEKTGHGDYYKIDEKKLPKLFIAYKSRLSKVSGKVLNSIRLKYEQKDATVISVLNEIADLAKAGKDAIESGNIDKLFALMNRNFDLRCSIMPISDSNMELVEIARACGASAKFAGSGGSIIGIYRNDAMLNRLILALKRIDARVIKPFIL
ncbi:MAG: GHMP kinase [Candidatus Marinimicrobia bacterium]|nr:GHMP kinase [Candidatus Neomarinimicrobiota bacterium]